jgi:hypothetical protein
MFVKKTRIYDLAMRTAAFAVRVSDKERAVAKKRTPELRHGIEYGSVAVMTWERKDADRKGGGPRYLLQTDRGRI